MAELTQWFTEHLVLGVLVLTRLSTLLMAIPSLGVGVPRRIKALLAILITVLLLPPVAQGIPENALPHSTSLIGLAVSVGREAMIGIWMGTTIQFLVAGFQTGGEIMSGTGGMNLGMATDPSSRAPVPVLSRLVGLMTTAILLGVGGHRWILSTLLTSFEVMPAGDLNVDESIMESVIVQLGHGFNGGIRIAAPVLAALLLSNLVTGLISRTLPQINILAIGFSFNALAMLVMLSLSISSVGYVYRDELVRSIEDLREVLSAMG